MTTARIDRSLDEEPVVLDTDIRREVIADSVTVGARAIWSDSDGWRAYIKAWKGTIAIRTDLGTIRRPDCRHRHRNENTARECARKTAEDLLGIRIIEPDDFPDR